jgi:hypothetical protein
MEDNYTKSQLKEFHLFNKFGITLSNKKNNNVKDNVVNTSSTENKVYQLSHIKNSIRLIHGNYSLCVYKQNMLSKTEKSLYHIIEYKK